MSELNIIIDNFGHKELKEYLMSLNGIFDVKITNDEYLDIYLKYDSSLITLNIIKMEIFNFLDIMKNPSMIAFNKYSKCKTLNYIIITGITRTLLAARDLLHRLFLRIRFPVCRNHPIGTLDPIRLKI